MRACQDGRKDDPTVGGGVIIFMPLQRVEHAIPRVMRLEARDRESLVTPLVPYWHHPVRTGRRAAGLGQDALERAGIAFTRPLQGLAEIAPIISDLNMWVPLMVADDLAIRRALETAGVVFDETGCPPS